MTRLAVPCTARRAKDAGVGVGLAERGAMTTSSVAPPSLVTTDSVDAAAEEAAGEGVAEGVAVGEAWGRTEEAGATDLLRRVAHAPVIVIADASARTASGRANPFAAIPRRNSKAHDATLSAIRLTRK